MHYELTGKQKILLYLVIFCMSTILFFIIPPVAIDWLNTYHPIALHPLQPYSTNSFVNAPWTAVIIYPLQMVSKNVGLVLNASITLVVFIILVISRNGKLLSIVLTMTSFPVLSGISNGALEWIPALGFLFQDGIGMLFLLTKPQSGLLGGLDWYLRSKNKKLFLIIPAVTTMLSLLIWPDWPSQLMANLQTHEVGLRGRNISLFPWTIPIGIALIYYIIKKRPENGELLGVLATSTLTPYTAFQSYSVLFTLISISYPKAAVITWVLLWIFIFLTGGSLIS